MSLAIVHSRGSVGINAPLVIVEVHLSKGIPGLSIAGLPETAVKESRHRVRSAIINSQLEFPTRRITVNLAPADLPKEGGRFDLAIALGILAASEQIPREQLGKYEFAGELALSGALRGIRGALPFLIATAKAKRGLVIALENVDEIRIALPISDQVRVANHLLDICAYLRGESQLSSVGPNQFNEIFIYPDLNEVNGQLQGKRALEIAAAGGHNLLFIGPPGAGKTMLAKRLPGILPMMEIEAALEVATIYSINRGGIDCKRWRQRPFRAPHHSISNVAMVGGGNPPRPGEITLAHQGILFLDELPEFSRSVLEALREPLEEKTITISRANYQVEFPSHFQLVATMNPCPCGYLGDPHGQCRCTSEQIHRYQSRLSGPLIDRIDMQVEIPPLAPDMLFTLETKAEASVCVRERVHRARCLQMHRYKKLNTMMTPNEVLDYCRLSVKDEKFIRKAFTQLALTTRGYHRLLKVARTIADLEAVAFIERRHLAEALSYRILERKRSFV